MRLSRKDLTPTDTRGFRKAKGFRGQSKVVPVVDAENELWWRQCGREVENPFQVLRDRAEAAPFRSEQLSQDGSPRDHGHMALGYKFKVVTRDGVEWAVATEQLAAIELAEAWNLDAARWLMENS